jgi:hypothetical protein
MTYGIVNSSRKDDSIRLLDLGQAALAMTVTADQTGRVWDGDLA